METRWATVDGIKERLKPLLEASPQGAVVFDADGTLWSHDVGVMTFDWSIEQALLRADAFTPLRAFAESARLVTRGTTTLDLAREIQTAFHRCQLEEQAAAEMQVWIYAGMNEIEFRMLVHDALLHKKHNQSLHTSVLELAEWVRLSGGRSFIVSASPQWVIEEATRAFGFSAQDIVAGRPNLSLDESGSATIGAGLAQPLPYGPEKAIAGRRLLGNRPWLAALGDSSFDLAMFQEAQIAVGIGQKPGMLAGLAQLSHGVRLHLERAF